jgi:hypothetical protein
VSVSPESTSTHHTPAATVDPPPESRTRDPETPHRSVPRDDDDLVTPVGADRDDPPVGERLVPAVAEHPEAVSGVGVRRGDRCSRMPYLQPVDREAPQRPASARVVRVQQLLIAGPFGLECGTTGDVGESVVVDSGDPQPCALPRHLQSAPLNPRDSGSVGGERRVSEEFLALRERSDASAVVGR